ncbi:MFS transporter [Candidatus Wolfebacteria bacterium]|nr:MFS transporter [Candidatus Wolfebacteria bacterium]
MRKYLTEIYLMHSIHGAAGALIGIFIPIYLLNLKFSLAQIIVYYFIYSAAVFLFSFFSGWLSLKIGLKGIVILSFPFLLGHIGTLYLLSYGFQTPLFAIAVLNGIQAAFYWFPLHLFFSRHSEIDSMGDQVARFFAWPKLAGILAPLIGAGIVAFGGFQLLILTAGLIYMASIVPLIYIPEFSLKIDFRFKKFISLFKRNTRYFFVEIAENIREDAEGILWPIFVFLTLQKVLSVGLVGTLAGIGSIIFTFLVGRYADKTNKKHLMKIAALMMALIWFARFYFPNEIVFYLSALLTGFFAILLAVPFTSIMYGLAKTKESEIEEFILFREIPVFLGRALLYTIVLFLIANFKYFLLFTAFSHAIFFFY